MGGRPMPKPQASCTQTVADGMVVKTQLSSPVAEKAQRSNLELLLLNHPLDCPICDKGGECPLQNQAMANGPRRLPASRARSGCSSSRSPISTRGPARPRTLRAVPALHPVLRPDRRRQVHRPAGARRRAADRRSTPDEPFQSYFSGNTIQICPVGALTAAAYRFRARPFDLVSTDRRLRALRGRLRDAHRPPARHRHCAGWPATTRRSTRSGTATRAASPSATSSEADRITRPLVRDADGELQPRRPGPRRWRSPPRACAAARDSRRRRRADRRPADRRGRLRLREVRPAGAAAPTTSTSGPARTPPRRRTSSPRTSSARPRSAAA